MSDNTDLSTFPPTFEDDDEIHSDSDQIVNIDDDTTNADEDSTTGEISLAKDETKTVQKFRIILLMILVATALAVSLSAFFMIGAAEQRDFESAFESAATKIIDTFESEAAEKRTAIIHVSRDLTSHAKFANETWPFVTLPSWEMKVRLTLELAEVIGLFVLPLVTRENVAKWKEYSVANQQWYWEGMAIQRDVYGVNSNSSGVEHFDDPGGLGISGDIIQFSVDGPNADLIELDNSTEGPFFPVWQYSPQIPVPVIGADFATLPDARPEVLSYLEDDSRRNMVSDAFEFEAGTGGAVFLELLLERWQAGDSKYVGGPLSYYYLPVYEDFGGGSPLVALLMAFIYWQTYFENLLPETDRGIQVVLQNTCDQNFTFSISGGDATFLGYEDMHDPTYDYLEASNDYGAFLQREPEDNGGCYYKLRVYPTEEFQDDYLTNRPKVVCLTILVCFGFTTLAFFLYDMFVEKRQQLVLKTAKQSSDVVDSLFPDTVRQRLYAKDNKKKEDSAPNGQFLAKSRRSSVTGGSSDASTITDPLNGCSPIADEYLNCTVFFADLAGFTKWSSARTPSEVFLLLETLYGAFDKIAKKLYVFKVETIGDCYVAVTGLPQPQSDHALIMCRFAASCMVKMNQLVNSEDLLLTLGDETSNLAMRVGMHSGPVTAGVLRGEKARFQLFGDTVNTAARMESNGQKGRIQVSQVTADLLVACGKEKWLTAREDLVEAKGKGKMQCYWVDIVSDPSMRSSIFSNSVVTSSMTDSVDLMTAEAPPPLLPPPQPLSVYDQVVSI